jgi:hypothetical protein
VRACTPRMSAWTRYAAQITRPGSSDSPARDCCDNRTLAVALKAGETTSNNQNARTGADGAAPQPAAVAFVTTEHFTLQGARTAAITESTSRATIFIGAVSAGLVALGLIAAATRIGTAFYAFGLILLSTLSFLGFVTLDRVLQSGIEELHYVERIARLRAYYFDFAPELTRYLASVPPSRRLALLGLRSGYWAVFRTTAGMIGVVTAVLTGSDAGLLATIAAGHSAVAGFVTGGVVGVAVLVALMWFQYSTWVQGHRLRLFEDEQERRDAG